MRSFHDPFPDATAASSPEELRDAYDRQRAEQLQRLLLRAHRDRLKLAAAGAAAGMATVVATCAVTRKQIAWHSFLWEALLCALAGLLLARRRRGILTGILLFSAAYLLATFVRALGLDPSVVFGAGDVARIGSVTGNLVALAILAAIGGVFGHVVENE